METKIRLRYAPSPTGHLHIGGVRTALFNYLYAKANSGSFIVRIEDTDIKREIEAGEKNQIDGLEWLGIEIDESPLNPGKFGPYRQMERLDIYQKYVDQLLEKGLAYKCYCSSEKLAKSREEQLARGIPSPKYDGTCLNNPHAEIPGVKPSIRMKMPADVDLSWNDGVRGNITINTHDIGDWVIQKSNGIPTYNFANVIDDHLMEITHVMRGEEHISNTPKQIHLYQIFGWEIPKFVHLTIITDETGKKLSKRNKEQMQFIHLFKEQGFLPGALFNFLSLLGWSPKTEEEIFTKEQLIDKFNIEGLSHSPTTFDLEKLYWINNYYIKKLDEKDLFVFLNPFVKDLVLTDDLKLAIFKVFQPQLHRGIEIQGLIKIFTENYDVDLELKDFAVKNIAVVKKLQELLWALDDWEKDELKTAINNTGKELGAKGKNLFMPIRIAITGHNHGPDLVSVMKIFGKEKTLKRLEDFINA